MNRKLKIDVMEEKVRQMLNKPKLRVPRSRKPLFEWIVPGMTSSGKLNWAEWVDEVNSQSKGLTDLIESGNSFFLWKKTQSNGTHDNNISMLDKETAEKKYLFEIMLQSYRPVLCDVEESEPNQRLVQSEEDAKKKRDSLQEALNIMSGQAFNESEEVLKNRLEVVKERQERRLKKWERILDIFDMLTGFGAGTKDDLVPCARLIRKVGQGLFLNRTL